LDGRSTAFGVAIGPPGRLPANNRNADEQVQTVVKQITVKKQVVRGPGCGNTRAPAYEAANDGSRFAFPPYRFADDFGREGAKSQRDANAEIAEEETPDGTIDRQ
jgi:hypothetical protein